MSVVFDGELATLLCPDRQRKEHVAIRQSKRCCQMDKNAGSLLHMLSALSV